MRAVIEKASVLIEALPYIQRFNGETVVVKFGGSIMEDAEGVKNILRDIAFMACVGMRPVIVHGGGKSISAEMEKRGLRPSFVQGLRVTDQASIDVVEHVLNHEVNPQLVSVLLAYDCKARGIHGDDILKVRKHTAVDEKTGQKLDWGFVGTVTGADVAPVEAFLHSGITPVITPLGRDEKRHIYNVNADEAAAAVAVALKARKLVFLSDVPGVLSDKDDETTIISSIKAGDIEDLVKRGIISGGMLPKISGAVKAMQAGVRKVHLIDAMLPHSLLLELFTDKGVGTEIVS
ncbi:MAG TPA: acetylglutamate kinase [Kiritimatiellia bacterium]|nr:acetylglutamate kinase [Kiritimatiellia bacterium]HNR93839.1 acetylglutamate kinase [Kiritimatiellia bacterium]HNS80531.1 acetylglutamate kinase [Kiritimatiellia bacterium]HPA78647.1 acetylglutamate kinase [Kiritimatiellia bacterium]HQQ04051.1 acetylglutamate kinase [Kiritimatiellia bacterium]